MNVTCGYCGHDAEHTTWGLMIRCSLCPDGRCAARENPEYPAMWRCLGTDDGPHDEVQFYARAVDEPRCWYCSRLMLPPGIATEPAA